MAIMLKRGRTVLSMLTVTLCTEQWRIDLHKTYFNRYDRKSLKFFLGCVICETDGIFRARTISSPEFFPVKYLILRPAPPPPPPPIKKAVPTVFLGLTERRKILRDPKLIPALPTRFLPPCWSPSEGHENHQSYSSAISTSLKTRQENGTF